MRLFIAVPMPGSVAKRLVELRQPIKGIRWQDEGKLHLTLKFLGETDSERALKVQDALTSVNLSEFSITLDGLGYFPKGNQPRVLWAGIEKSEPLQVLYQIVENRCADFGFDPEQRSFKPHVTIGRVKGASKSNVESFIDQHKQFNIPDIPVEEFVLFESKLHPDGAKHYRRKSYSLS